MGSASRSSQSLGDRLAARSRRVFVGRDAELELVRAALDSHEPPFAVLYLHGPGGIGKTRLLDAFAAVAHDAGCDVTRIDGRTTEASPDAVLEAVESDTVRRQVLLLDSYERLRPLDHWIRTVLLPALPASALTVIADRSPPAADWRTEPGWGDLLRVVSLRNLDPDDSAEYLTEAGVPAELHKRIVTVTHGHPLGLSLLADVCVRGGEIDVDPLSPDLVEILLRRFLDTDPGNRHRRALEVCALARVTTEAVLRDALEVEDAHAEFEWLRNLSFVDSGPEGLFPHDLARDVLDADLRWRDPDVYRHTFHRVWKRIHRNLDSMTDREQQRAIVDLKFVFRNLPGVLSPVDWGSWGRDYPERATGADHESIIEVVRSAEGTDSADIARHWLGRQPEGFHVLRRPDGTVRGVIGLLDLTQSLPSDLATDPGARAAWDYAQRTARPRSCETVTLTRFVVDREVYQDPSPTLNSVPVITMQRYLCTPELSWDFLALAEPERWDSYFEVADLPRAEDADFVVGGRRYGLYAHDFRRRPTAEWLTLVTERALAQGHDMARPAPAPVLVLSEAEFGSAARRALHDLHRPDLLLRNPLLRTRLLHERAAGGEPGAEALGTVVRAAVAALANDPRDEKLHRAVDRTYIQRAATQEAVAARLGLPFSTYRRHLSQGVSRVVTWLWDREVYGPALAGGNE
ncbi:ATP-binding protein [Rhodococcus chondri]|uniref:ATP-binding protein n=1 Tax=Rhodococcus chondri TaxID=3065941 RepID=A0ABU7JUF9_9NOCA|nr:ATP-binding protein [Rhodococcus sp. CC-R104]MEE2033666.1 ATP-binding protein [Rhodococcus sp. CC-R104]